MKKIIILSLALLATAFSHLAAMSDQPTSVHLVAALEQLKNHEENLAKYYACSGKKSICEQLMAEILKPASGGNPEEIAYFNTLCILEEFAFKYALQHPESLDFGQANEIYQEVPRLIEFAHAEKNIVITPEQARIFIALRAAFNVVTLLGYDSEFLFNVISSAINFSQENNFLKKYSC
jgi:hypothetical protein